MPKRASTAYESDDGFVKHEPDSDTPASKRSKTKASTPKQKLSKSGAKLDDEGNEFWELNTKGTRRVSITEFKGNKMVNIREYYEKDGKMLPGKKGISLMVDQYEALIKAMPAIETILIEKGQSVSRPDYDGGRETVMADADDTETSEEQKPDIKKNFEETSSEDD